ncbi:MAG: dephospho-CoA kinase [Syntrophales bacterium]|jgi:dephospho-CoA kinase|nr:dephospho-CoA kinase [Syntrophales bacterium]
MLNVGLTGGIASGKSTVARILVEKGALLIDLDELAHEVEAPEGEVWEKIVHHFGEGVLSAERTIDRKKLGAIVFANPSQLLLLNELVHPAVFEAWQRRLRELRQASPEAIVLSAIPLLIESGMVELVDLVLLVYLPPEKQIARLIRRNGYSLQEAKERIASQMAIEEKMRHADIIINNEGSEEETARELIDIWEELKKREKEVR